MAQEVQILLVCDRCEGRTEAVVTAAFSYSGRSLQVDLCASHQGDFEATMQSWADVARGASRGPRPKGLPKPTGTPRQKAPRVQHQVPYDEASVRTWAVLAGVPQGDGRVSPTTIKKWREAGSPV